MIKQIDELKNSTDENRVSVVENLGIYELRALARFLGVVSPTTKKRDFLVNAILEKLSKNEPSVPSEQKKGRPYKKLESMDNILMLVNNDAKAVDLDNVCTFEDMVLLAQEIPVFDYSSDEKVEKEGVLRIVKDSVYFIDKNDGSTIFVPMEMVEKFDLQNGDYLNVMASRINGKNQFNARAISKTNGDEPQKNQVSKTDLVKVLPTKMLKVEDKEILMGGRNFYVLSQPLYLDQTALKVLYSAHNLGEVIYISSNACEENELVLNGLKDCKIFGNKLSRLFELNKVIDVINYSTRQIELGKSFVIVIEDVFDMLDALDKCFVADGEKVLGHAQQTNIIMEKLLGLTGAFNKDVNSSMIVLVNGLDIEDAFIKNKILKTSKKI